MSVVGGGSHIVVFGCVGVVAYCCGFGLSEFVLKFEQLNRNLSI